VVQRASVRWEHSRGFLGQGERICKVVVPPVVRHVEREVVVKPTRRVAQVTPAVYKHVARRVFVAPGSVQKVYHPAVTGWVTHPVVLKRARTYSVYTPAAVGNRQDRVLVRHGGYGWQRVR